MLSLSKTQMCFDLSSNHHLLLEIQQTLYLMLYLVCWKLIEICSAVFWGYPKYPIFRREWSTLVILTTPIVFASMRFVSRSSVVKFQPSRLLRSLHNGATETFIPSTEYHGAMIFKESGLTSSAVQWCSKNTPINFIQRHIGFFLSV